MNAKELLQKIKQLFELPPAGTVVKTADGIEVTVSKLEVGGTATINGMPAPANTYVLEDGSAITTDATGVITAITPVAAPAPAPAVPAAAAAPPAAPAPAAPVAAAAIELTEELKTPEGMRALYEKFAVGTPEERMANLELVCKALMEYCFGYEMRQAKEKADRDAAIAAYQNTIAAMQQEVDKQKDGMRQMVALMEQIVGAPTSDPPVQTKKKFSFSNTEGKKKSFARFAEAAKQIAVDMKQANN